MPGYIAHIFTIKLWSSLGYNMTVLTHLVMLLRPVLPQCGTYIWYLHVLTGELTHR